MALQYDGGQRSLEFYCWMVVSTGCSAVLRAIVHKKLQQSKSSIKLSEMTSIASSLKGIDALTKQVQLYLWAKAEKSQCKQVGNSREMPGCSFKNNRPCPANWCPASFEVSRTAALRKVCCYRMNRRFLEPAEPSLDLLLILLMFFRLRTVCLCSNCRQPSHICWCTQIVL